MKKLLITAIIILLIILTGITMIKGINVGKLSVLGIKDIKKEDEQLNTTIQQATKLASTDYQKKINDLNDQIKKLENEKQEYEDMVNVSTETQTQTANQFLGGYKIEYLCVRIGTHAKTEGVEMKMDVSRSSSGTEETYNLNFTATGAYARIAEFITDIEDDSSLGFKIEEFKMLADSSSDTSTLQATFVCKDVKIEGVSSTTSTTTQTETTSQNNNTVDNTTTNTTANNNKYNKKYHNKIIGKEKRNENKRYYQRNYNSFIIDISNYINTWYIII